MDLSSKTCQPQLNCDGFAYKHKVDNERALVWHAFSQLYLDVDWTEEELACIGEQIAMTKFTLQELSLILLEEVFPVCAPNKLMLVGGEGPLGFDLDWLMKECSNRQNKKTYQLSESGNHIPWTFHFKAPLVFEGYLMLYRIKRIRDKRPA